MSRKSRDTTQQQKLERNLAADSNRTLQPIRSTVNMEHSYRDALVRSAIIIAFPPVRLGREETEGQAGSGGAESGQKANRNARTRAMANVPP